MALTGVIYASQGLLVGRVTNGQLPQMSALYEQDGQHYAVDLSRIEPGAAWVFFASDLVNSLKYGKISRGEYAAGIAELTASMSLMTLDRSFNKGLQNMSQILDIKNWSFSTGSSLIGVLFGGPAPAIGRGIGTVADPTQDIAYGPGDRNAIRNYWNVLGQRYTAQNAFFEEEAKDYHPLTGEIKMRAPVPPNENPGLWDHMTAAFMELMPFKIVNTIDPNHPSVLLMNEYGLELPDKTFRFHKGIDLSPAETSMLKKEFSTVGQFNERFAQWMDDPEQKRLKLQIEKVS